MKIKEIFTVKTCIIIFCMALMFAIGYFAGRQADVSDISITPGVGESLQLEGGTNTTLININTATAEELDTLPDVGPTLAKRIVDYRTENGSFDRIEDIGKVEGIGDGVFAKIRHLITV